MVAEDENEDSGPRRSPEHVKELIKVKTRSFLSMVDEMRDKTFTGAIEVWRSKANKKEDGDGDGDEEMKIDSKEENDDGKKDINETEKVKLIVEEGGKDGEAKSTEVKEGEKVDGG